MMKRNFVWITLPALVFMLCGEVVLARPAIFTLRELVEKSDTIVVAKVSKISRLKSGLRVADAQVLEVWKGAPVDRVLFRASPYGWKMFQERQLGKPSYFFYRAGESLR